MKYIIGNLIVLPLAFSITSAALADDEEESIDELGPERCVSVRAVRRPEIIDDRHIVFHASGKRMYLNRLPSNCLGLKRAGRISYEISNRLCANDRVNVLDSVGSRLRVGISCRLGHFQSISKEELDQLRDPTAVRPEQAPVKQPEIEDVIEADVEDVVED